MWLNGDDFTKTPVETLNKIEAFLGVDQFFKKQHFDFSGLKGYPCFKLDPLSNSKCMGKGKAREHPVLSEESMNILRNHYRPIIEKFNSQTGLNIQLS